MWVSSYFPPPPPEVGARGSAKQSRLIADIYLVRWADGDCCSGSCVPERIFSRLRGTAPRSKERSILSEACRGKGDRTERKQFYRGPRSKSQSPKSSWAVLNQRKVTVVYVRKGGGADAAVTGLVRCGA